MVRSDIFRICRSGWSLNLVLAFGSTKMSRLRRQHFQKLRFVQNPDAELLQRRDVSGIMGRRAWRGPHGTAGV